MAPQPVPRPVLPARPPVPAAPGVPAGPSAVPANARVPNPPARPGAVAQESEASQPLHFLQSELLSAKAQWERLGIRIARGYLQAYRIHEKTLKDMKKAKGDSLDNGTLIFIFSILGVGIAGGLVGGLMATWVDKAGSDVAKKVLRTTVAGVPSQAATSLMDAGIKKLWETKVADEPYTPKVPTSDEFDLEIRDRIGSLFGPVLEAVTAMIAAANHTNASREAGQAVLNQFRQHCPLITDQPTDDQIPSLKQAATAAELAMWVAWANKADWFFWDKVYAAMDVGWMRAKSELSRQHGWHAHAADYAMEMEPVGDRLLDLGKWAACLTVVHATEAAYHIFYTDLRKLRALRLDDGTLPFRKLSGLHMQWNRANPLEKVKFLDGTVDVKPAYKS
jgi:hypothetical protein